MEVSVIIPVFNEKATKEVIVIQDADLEYDPKDLAVVLKPIQDGNADVVSGARFLGIHRALLFWHSLGNKLLTFITNILSNNMLTAMETGDTAFLAPILKRITIRSHRCDVEPEITAQVLKCQYRIYEVPIYYAGRDLAITRPPSPPAPARPMTPPSRRCQPAAPTT